MFILKSTHKEILNNLEASHLSDIYHFEARIADLKCQIEDLKRLIFIQPPKMDKTQYELDSVVSGSDKPVEMSEEEHHRLINEAREVDLLVSGNYSEDMYQ